MFIVTQDGRTLELKSSDNVEFTAVYYSDGGNCSYVNVRVTRGRGKKKAMFNVKLAEYDFNDFSTAQWQANELTDAFYNGTNRFTLKGFKDFALNDDLQISIDAVAEFLAPCYVDFGSINGISNGTTSFDINPDSLGSYRKAINKRLALISAA